MPRHPRHDEPGLLFHVMNRGLAKRTVFETRKDIRFFLALLAWEVRAGRIEILAYTVLTTHFHLLVRSRTAELDRVMQRVLNTYVRYFNRTRRRDGPLFRSRYMAKPVRSLRYRRILFRYIDQNATAARLAHDETMYPYCSAYHYASHRRPPWLSTDIADEAMGHPAPSERLAAYARVFGRRIEDQEIRLIERRLIHGWAEGDDWDSLIGAAPVRVLDWMCRKARLADGTKPGLPYVDASRIVDLVDIDQRTEGKWLRAMGGKRRRDGWPVLRVGLLRDLGGLTYAEISRRTGNTPSMVVRRIAQHALLLRQDAEYAAKTSTLASRCLGESH